MMKLTGFPISQAVYHLSSQHHSGAVQRCECPPS